jgi:hypothetical protein
MSRTPTVISSDHGSLKKEATGADGLKLEGLPTHKVSDVLSSLSSAKKSVLLLIYSLAMFM